MSEQVTVLQASKLLGWMQKRFERWQDKYIIIASISALILAAPLALGSLSTIIFRTNLDNRQIVIFLNTLAALSILSGTLVFLDIYFLTANARTALKTKKENRENPLSIQQRILAWQEIALLPNRVIWAISTTLFLTYILPMGVIMHSFAQTSTDETVYIILGQLLAGVNLIISAYLIFKFFMMPVYNYLAPSTDNTPLERLTMTHMSSHIILQNTAITLLILLIIGPRAYYQITHALYHGIFYSTPISQVRSDLLIITAATIIISLIYSTMLAYVTSAPARYITNAIAKIQQGSLHLRAPVIASDEIGQIAIYLNRLLNQTQELQHTLSQQVEERTAMLEKRTIALQAITQIAENAARFDNVSDLIDSLIENITEHFRFYHVGLFTVDERSGYAILRATNSPGGQHMLARGHRLRLGEGIVGTVAQQRKARIVLDVGADAVFFNNPDLPDTHSEMALPLLARGRIIGVLDIQSKETNAFQYENVEILQTLANQIALAIENTRLLEESRQALQELQIFAQGQVRKNWQTHLAGQQYAVTYTGLGYKVGEIDDNAPEAFIMKIPIKIQDTPIGTLKLRRRNRPWTQSERKIASQISQQIALALESARLLDTTQQFAEREKTISQIAASMRQSLDMDAVLRTTVNELQQKLGLAEAEIQLISPDNNQKKRG